MHCLYRRPGVYNKLMCRFGNSTSSGFPRNTISSILLLYIFINIYICTCVYIYIYMYEGRRLYKSEWGVDVKCYAVNWPSLSQLVSLCSLHLREFRTIASACTSATISSFTSITINATFIYSVYSISYFVIIK